LKVAMGDNLHYLGNMFTFLLNFIIITVKHDLFLEKLGVVLFVVIIFLKIS